MNNKNIRGLFINPFTRIAGWQAFGLGLAFVLLTGLLGKFGNLFFGGLLNIHITPLPEAPPPTYSLFSLAIVISLTILTTWLMALIFVRGFRLIDIFGTITLTYAPFLILAFVSLFIPEFSDQASSKTYLVFMFAFRILLVPVILWHIILVYNAIKVSLNIKNRNSR